MSRSQKKYTYSDDQSKLTCAYMNTCIAINTFSQYIPFSTTFSYFFKALVMTDDASTAYICIYCPFNSDNLEALENHLTSIKLS
jgi:hypothetical protein